MSLRNVISRYDFSESVYKLAEQSHQLSAKVASIFFISRKSVEMFEELIEISDDELNTMDQLVHGTKDLAAMKNNDLFITN